MIALYTGTTAVHNVLNCHKETRIDSIRAKKTRGRDSAAAAVDARTLIVAFWPTVVHPGLRAIGQRCAQVRDSIFYLHHFYKIKFNAEIRSHIARQVLSQQVKSQVTK